MSLIKKLAGETMIYGMGSVLPKILNFIILTPYFTRVFKTSDYGKHTLLYAFVALMMVIATFRMETAFFRFGTKEKSADNTFSTAFIGVSIITLFLVLITFLFSSQIAVLINIPNDPIYVRYFAGIILFDALSSIAFARLRIENKAIKFSWIKIINVLINVTMILFFLELCPILHKNYPNSINWFYDKSKELDYAFISNLIASLGVFILLIKVIFQSKFVFDKVLFKQMVKYSLPLIIVGIAAVINGLSDRYFIMELLPGTMEENIAQVGIYGGSVKIAVLMSLFTTAFNYAAEPFFFKQANSKNKAAIYTKVTLAFSAVASIVFLGIMLYIDIIQYLIGTDYREAIAVVPILLMAFLFLGLFYNFSIWYKITDKTYVGAVIATIGSIITIGFNIILIPKIGYIGAAWAMLACYGFMTITAYLWGQKEHKIPYPIKRILMNIIGAIIIYFISIYCQSIIQNNWSVYLINTILLSIYIITIYKLEWNYINETIED